MFWLELAVVLAAIVVGSRMGGFGLGIMGGLGLTILTFAFGVRPTSPPVDVILMIIAVVCAAGALQAAGGLDYLVALAARILRSHPAYVTFLAPAVTFFFTLFAGTAHVAYSVLPVISEVARGTGTRPERPLSIAVIAASMGISASPVTAVTMSFLALVAPLGITLADILMVSIPAHFLGIMLGAVVASRMGKDLDKDEAYRERVAAGLCPAVGDPQKLDASLSTDVPFSAKFSVILFLMGAVAIVLLGSFPSVRPVWEVAGKQVRMNMPVTIQMVMLSVAAIILLATRVKPSRAVSGGVFSAGIQAVVAIFGIAWMGTAFSPPTWTCSAGGSKP